MTTENQHFIREFKLQQHRMYEIAAQHGFHENDNKIMAEGGENAYNLAACKLSLIHSEVSEILEGIRKNKKEDDHIPEFTAAEAEAADAVIRLMDYAEMYGLRLGEAIMAKAQYNESRPYKHGKKF